MNKIGLVRHLTVTLLCLFSACGAMAETMTFDDISAYDIYPPSFTEGGLMATSLAAAPEGPHLYFGYKNLKNHSNLGSSPIQFKRVDGANFNFVIFDYMGGDSVFTADNGASFTILKGQPWASFTMPAAFHNVS